MQTTAYLANVTRVVLDLFMIGTKTQRNNKYMLSGKIVQYWLGILLYIFSAGQTFTLSWVSTNIFIGKDNYTAFRQYKYFHKKDY